MGTATFLPPTAELGLIRPLVRSLESSQTGNGTPDADETWQRIAEELRALHDLEDDWDGQGSSPPDPANLDSARNWLERMRYWPSAVPPNKIAPGVTGEVLVVWQQPGLYLEAEITGANEVEWLWTADNQQTRQWKTDVDGGWIIGAVAIPAAQSFP